ncbi:5691_t:CDS:2 [Entrophospora sp. SA101]|nr:5691_t:CDS:2 [Entrophospora sp. SA101]CAJ0846404.1 8179_t:CDS:2 [Entrophospora sp. SA101]CAJ0876734.1 463_t:CDS:2 [Entrophospora sp. SA101]
MTCSKKVVVTEISSAATEKTVKDFFLFCGKMKEFELVKDEKSDKQIAYVTFERDAAVKTALMLTNAVIGDSPITVRPADGSLNPDDGNNDQLSCIEQEEKPKKVIFAEILAAGFQLQDSIIQKGLEFDCKCGISGRLMYYLHQLQDNLKALDDQYKVYDKVSATAVQLDTKFAVQDKIKYVTTQAQDKVNQAIETPAGKIMLEYYLSTTKQVADVHAEARRIADEKQVKLITSHEEESTNGSL